MSTPFALSICADDYAIAPGVSRGILEALEAGAVSATSVMTTSPWWPEAAEPLRRHVGRADIGLHLNLTLGEPLGPLPQLAPTGRLPSIGTLMRLARLDALPTTEILEEVDRQAQRFVDVFGRPPDHVDGHQHVHVLGPVAPIVQAVCEQRGWRPWLRDSADKPLRVLSRGIALKKALGLAVLARGYGGRARRAGFPTNEGFAGFSSFDPASSYARQFARYLTAPGTRHLVMCHPGYADDELRKLDPVVECRETELRFLVSGDFARQLANAGATLRRLDRGTPAAKS